MDLYAENILDHYRHPRKKSPVSREEGCVMHKEVNASCGDEIVLRLQIKNDRIVDIAWDGAGCAISQAGMSMLAEELMGMSTEAACALTPQTMFAMLGVPIGARRMKCALLSLHGLKNTIHVLRGEPIQDWNITMHDVESLR